MTDGKDYTVTLSGVTKEFTATNNTVAAVSVDPVTIPYGTETEIKAIAKDSNGVELASFVYGNPPSNYTFTIETSNGYTNGSKLYLVNKGDTAKAKVVYHSGKYDENGKEVGNVESGDVTITAVDPAVVTVNNFKVRLNKDASKTFDTVADNTKVAVEDVATAYFKIVDSNNKEIANYGDYTLETSNKDVMILGSNKIVDKKVTVTPVAEGTAYIVVKDAKGNVVSTLAISIVSTRKAASLVLDTSSFELSNAVADTKVVKVTIKDQYGDEMAAQVPVVECVAVSGDGAATKDQAKAFANATAGKVTFSAQNNAAGVYTYTIKAADLTKTVVFTIKAPNATATSTYSLVLGANSADAVVKSADDKNKTVSVKVAELKGGVTNSYDNGFKITVTDKDGKAAQIGGDDAYADGTLTITKEAGDVVAKLAAGTYTVTATATKDSKPVKLTRSFTVTDTQPAVTAERIADTVDNASETDIAASAFKYVYDGKVYSAGTVDGKAGTITVSEVEKTGVVEAGKNVFFKTATVQIPVADGVYISVKVNINKTVTIK